MSNEEIAKELLSVLMEKMWFRGVLPSEGWAVEKICKALEASKQSVQTGLSKTCRNCGGVIGIRCCSCDSVGVPETPNR